MATQYTTNYVPPEPVCNFIKFFHKYFATKNIYEIRNFYQVEFHMISERYFKSTSWPPPQAIASQCSHDKVFLALYTELYFRHLHWKLADQIDIYQRFNSWLAYQNLFSTLCEAPADMVLPEEWLYDIVDEYIYQFQAFCRYRSSENLSDAEVALLRDNGANWDMSLVLQTLKKVTDCSGLFNVKMDSKAPTTTMQKMGYFSLVGLVRMQLLLGDYHTTMKLLAILDTHRLKQFVNVNACYVSLHYFRGFAMLMTRQYGEAVKIFSKMLLFIERIGVFKGQRSHHNSMIRKKHEKMVCLLAISHALCPGLPLPDSLRKLLDEKMEVKLMQMKSSEGVALDNYEQIFRYGCPKFITTATRMTENEASEHQTQLFMNEVRHHHQLPKIYNLLKLYRTLSLTKLATLDSACASKQDVEKLRRQLICLKHKTRADSSAGSGAFSGTHFWMDNTTVHVIQQQTRRNYGGFFMRHLEKLDDIAQGIESQWQAKKLEKGGGTPLN